MRNEQVAELPTQERYSLCTQSQILVGLSNPPLKGALELLCIWELLSAWNPLERRPSNQCPFTVVRLESGDQARFPLLSRTNDLKTSDVVATLSSAML